MDKPEADDPAGISLDELRERIDIAEVIGRRVKLEPRGRGLVGLCPFHEEQTPTFNVVPHKFMYHCFGCGDGGDVFKFVMLTEGLSFPDAVDKLAEGVGVDVPNDGRQLGGPASRAKHKEGERMSTKPAGSAPRGMIVYCVDVGSIAAEHLGWARVVAGKRTAGGHGGADAIQKLSKMLHQDLRAGRLVALGFEAPMWVPVAAKADDLGQKRPMEKKAWSAGAGATVLATAIPQVVWLLSTLNDVLGPADVFLDWTEFSAAKSGLFLWEAMITGKDKAQGAGRQDEQDAEIGALAFAKHAQRGTLPQRETGKVFSLIGGALLRAGLGSDAGLLGQTCMVVAP